MAAGRGYRIEVIVGEEITTRSGHLLGLFLSRPIAPLRSMRWSVAAIHEQGGLAIPAHPRAHPHERFGTQPAGAHRGPRPSLPPRRSGSLQPDDGRAALASAPGGLRRAARTGRSGQQRRAPAVAHRQATTRFEGRTAADLRRAIEARTTTWDGAFYPPMAQVGMFGRQVRKYARDVRDEVRGKLLRDGTGRDLGYPGGRRRPARYEGDTRP
jgi:hypothetical protein